VKSSRHITLSQGNGGRLMRALIEGVFAARFGHGELDTSLDATPISLPDGVVCVTTDGFSVQPLEFPGGNAGSLAVNGTVNDLAVAGARAIYLTLGVIIEEGLETAVLERIIDGIDLAASAAGVRIVAGDTKVVPRGQGGGIYLTTTGIGVRPPALRLGLNQVQPGDKLLVSGSVGDHGAAVMLAREDFDLKGTILSDCASVLPLTEAALPESGVRFMRDPTRGGLATVMHEIAAATSMGVRLREAAIPVRDAVRSVCEILGFDPYYLACEGRVVAVASSDGAEDLLTRWKSLPNGRDAAIIGEIVPAARRVVLETVAGGERFLEELEDDPMPRIC
jgi:hydrogenase expression/formation protein HypE